MRRNIYKWIAGTIGLIVLLGINGCILDPKTDKDTPDPVKIQWPDLALKEDVITVIDLCYKHYQDASYDELENHYQGVLYLASGDNYIWNNQVPVGEPGPPTTMTRDEDIVGTRFIWEESSGLILDMSTTAASWEPVPEICEECWETTRSYSITTTIQSKPYQGIEMRVKFIVRPNHDNPEKWAIYIAYDLPGI